MLKRWFPLLLLLSWFKYSYPFPPYPKSTLNAFDCFNLISHSMLSKADVWWLIVSQPAISLIVCPRNLSKSSPALTFIIPPLVFNWIQRLLDVWVGFFLYIKIHPGKTFWDRLPCTSEVLLLIIKLIWSTRYQEDQAIIKMHTRKKHVIKVQGQSKGISSQRKQFVLGREPFIYRRADSGQVIGIMIDSFNSHRKIRTHHSTGQIHKTRG